MQQFNKVNNKTKIKSYGHLNKKYNLNFSDYNFGFDWEVFKDFVSGSYADILLHPVFLNLFLLEEVLIKY